MTLISTQSSEETSTNSLLSSMLDTASLDQLIGMGDTLTLPTHHRLFQQGDIGHEMYLILEGRLEISLVLPNGDAVVVNQLNPGDSFGEIALFDQRQRTASVKTVSPCKLLVFQRDHFVDFLLHHPEVTLQLLNIFAKQIRLTNDTVKETLYTNISTRLARTINNIAHAYGRYTPDGLKIDCHFSDADLGEISGLATEIVTTHLRDWQAKGLVSLKNGYIIIHDPNELNRLESRFI